MSEDFNHTVHIRWSNGCHDYFMVGSREEARKECMKYRQYSECVHVYAEGTQVNTGKLFEYWKPELHAEDWRY